jgi:hypothetical protein
LCGPNRTARRFGHRRANGPGEPPSPTGKSVARQDTSRVAQATKQDSLGVI